MDDTWAAYPRSNKIHHTTANEGLLSTKIEGLRKTIDRHELSQEDVWKMEREKGWIEEQIAKQEDVLEGQFAALEEAKENCSVIYRLLEQRVEEYNSMARYLELVPQTVKHAKGFSELRGQAG